MTYREKRKLNGSDHYGVWREGKLVSAEVICGITISAQLKGNRSA